jgi:hypothetical protein
MATPIRRTTPKYAAHALMEELSSAPSFSWLGAVVTFGAVCVMIGVYWDISWHMSIGRDSFWTPAHLLIQAGGLIAGLSSGYVAIRTTFGGSVAAQDASVTFWGFKAPLGAWVAIWGCFAMVSSAPFDDWWHNAYGLDVRIISPPHMVLAMGIAGVGIGALLLTLAAQNRDGKPDRRSLWLFLIAGSLLFMDRAIMLTEFSWQNLMHDGAFYRISALAYPMVLVLMARASKMRWAATITAGLFTALMLALMWIIQLFPATPKLGPIYQNITHMVAMDFPVLVVFPAIGIDLVMQRLTLRPLLLAPILAAVFVVLFVAVQWPFASFLMSPAARNWFFNVDNHVYWMTQRGVEWSREWQHEQNAAPFVAQLGYAVLIGSFSSWVGLHFGNWMTKVKR